MKGKKKVTRKFKSGGLHERHVVATWKLYMYNVYVDIYIYIYIYIYIC